MSIVAKSCCVPRIEPKSRLTFGGNVTHGGCGSKKACDYRQYVLGLQEKKLMFFLPLWDLHVRGGSILATSGQCGGVVGMLILLS